MRVPGFKKDYLSCCTAGGSFEVTLRHKAESEHFYVIVYSADASSVASFKNIYDARCMFNKLVKALRKVDKVHMEVSKEIAAIVEEFET